MSWLSQFTGVHVSPKGVGLSAPDPLGAVKNAVTNPLFDAGLALAIPGVGSAITAGLGAIPGVGGALASGATAVGSALDSGAGAIKGAVSAIPGATSVGDLLKSGGSSLLKDAGSFLTGNGGLNALGVAQGVNSVLNSQKASGYADDALKSVNDSYNARAPLRAKGIAELTNPTVPSLAGINATRTTGSPYAGMAA